MNEATANRGLTPREVARRYRVSREKVMGWLARGELIGVNVAPRLSGRPQWIITPEALERFERGRTAATPPKPAPRRRRRPAMVDYFPD